MTDYNKFIGEKINELTIISVEGKYFVCKCDCGNVVKIRSFEVLCENKKSCGCRKTRLLIERSTTHGLSRHPLRQIHYEMVSRCTRETHPRYKDYGARGISVCKEWLSYVVFYKWCMDNNWKVGLNVDRQDNNGNYEPSNCRIVSYKINNNNKRNNIVIEYKGETKTLMQWAQSLNLNYEMLYARFKRHNPIPEKLFAQ